MLGMYDEDIAWLRELNKSLWDGVSHPGIAGAPARLLTWDELAKVQTIITEHDLVTSMCSTSMFGSIGLMVYANPEFPGDGIEGVVVVPEHGLPHPTATQHLLEDVDPSYYAKVPASSSKFAWDTFSRFTHTDLNKKRIQHFKLPESREQSYYDY